MKTAQEFVNLTMGYMGTMPMDLKDAMILFAKQHVQAALEAAKNKILSDSLKTFGTEISDCWDLNSIDNCYPLENIQ